MDLSHDKSTLATYSTEPAMGHMNNYLRLYAIKDLIGDNLVPFKWTTIKTDFGHGSVIISGDAKKVRNLRFVFIDLMLTSTSFAHPSQVITCPEMGNHRQSPAFVWDVASNLKSYTKLVIDDDENDFNCPVVASPDGKYIYASGWTRETRIIYRWEL